MVALESSDESPYEEIWRVPKLREFLEHEDPAVRRWALRRLDDEVSEDEMLADLAAEMLADERGVAFEAIQVLADCSTDALRDHRDTIRAYARRETTSETTRGTSLAIAAGLGDEDARAEVFDRAGDRPVGWAQWARHDPEGFTEAFLEEYGGDALPGSPGIGQACMLAGRPELVDVVFEAIDSLDDHGDKEEILYFVAARAGTGLVTELEADDFGWRSKEEVSPILRPSHDLFEEHSGRDRTDALIEAANAGNWERATELLLDSLDELVDAGIDDVDSPAIDWAVACGQALGARPDLFGEPELCARLALSLETGARCSYGLESVLQSSRTLTEKLEVAVEAQGFQEERAAAFVMETWDELDDDSERRSFVETLERWLQEADELEQLEERLWLASQIEELDLEEEVEEYVDRAIAASGESWEDWRFDLLAGFLSDAPAILRQRAEDLLHGPPQLRDLALGALGGANLQWATELLADHLDDLLQTHDATEVWYALGELGDPRVLDRLVEEWRPGEPSLDRCVGRTAKLSGRFEELDEQIRESYRAEMLGSEESFENLRDALDRGDDLFDALDDEPLNLQLQCTECGRGYNYEVEQVFFDLEFAMGGEDFDEAFVAGRIITCKNCEAVDAYELTERARILLMPYVVEMTERMEERDQNALMEGRVVPTNFELWDGTTIRKPSRALSHLRDLADDQPNNAEAWLRLGNFSDRFGKHDEAIEAWHRAIEVDDREVEAPYQIADALWEQDDPPPDEAREHLLEALRRLPVGSPHSTNRYDLAFELVEKLRSLVESTGTPSGLIAVSAPQDVAGRATVDMSSANLQRIEQWDRLAAMFADGAFTNVEFEPEGPDEVGRLEQAINSAGAVRRRPGGPDPSTTPGHSTPSAANEPYVKSEDEDVGRNDPCPCGSGRKYKKCCLRKRKS